MNGFYRYFEAFLNFIVQMKWPLLIIFGALLAWKLGLSPEVILDWMAKVFGTAIGGG